LRRNLAGKKQQSFAGREKIGKTWKKKIWLEERQSFFGNRGRCLPHRHVGLLKKTQLGRGKPMTPGGNQPRVNFSSVETVTPATFVREKRRERKLNAAGKGCYHIVLREGTGLDFGGKKDRRKYNQKGQAQKKKSCEHFH